MSIAASLCREVGGHDSQISGSFSYLRRDLLDRYLTQTGKALVWLMWGVHNLGLFPHSFQLAWPSKMIEFTHLAMAAFGHKRTFTISTAIEETCLLNGLHLFQLTDSGTGNWHRTHY